MAREIACSHFVDFHAWPGRHVSVSTSASYQYFSAYIELYSLASESRLMICRVYCTDVRSTELNFHSRLAQTRFSRDDHHLGIVWITMGTLAVVLIASLLMCIAFRVPWNHIYAMHGYLWKSMESMESMYSWTFLDSMESGW